MHPPGAARRRYLPRRFVFSISAAPTAPHGRFSSAYITPNDWLTALLSNRPGAEDDAGDGVDHTMGPPGLGISSGQCARSCLGRSRHRPYDYQPDDTLCKSLDRVLKAWREENTRILHPPHLHAQERHLSIYATSSPQREFSNLATASKTFFDHSLGNSGRSSTTI
jgi:hypothetical protein